MQELATDLATDLAEMSQSEGLCTIGFEDLLSRIIVGSMILHHGDGTAARLGVLQERVDSAMRRYRGEIH